MNERVGMRRKRAAQRELIEDMERRFPHLRRRRKDGGEPAPVDPDRPSHLSGGAAAPLDATDGSPPADYSAASRPNRS